MVDCLELPALREDKLDDEGLVFERRVALGVGLGKGEDRAELRDVGWWNARGER